MHTRLSLPYFQGVFFALLHQSMLAQLTPSCCTMTWASRTWCAPWSKCRRGSSRIAVVTPSTQVQACSGLQWQCAHSASAMQSILQVVCGGVEFMQHTALYTVELWHATVGRTQLWSVCSHCACESCNTQLPTCY